MVSSKFAVIVATLFACVLAAPAPDAGAKPFTLKNGQDAIALNCVALPLVNKPGTSITCDTTADRDARIAATGATHPGQAAPAPAPATAPPPADNQVLSDDKTSFTLSNGKATQALNKQFASLTTSVLTAKFVLTGCAGGLQCAVLPLVNSPGTSITCVDNAQAVARIAATGAGSSLTGN
ncbi:hypothetical protein BU17DRAFT_101799 [Hysterangium stoloniferum]|nr:hypothetical protein BU17DRAFT_101799 [Hysterangium stoloniferum]